MTTPYRADHIGSLLRPPVAPGPRRLRARPHDPGPAAPERTRLSSRHWSCSARWGSTCTPTVSTDRAGLLPPLKESVEGITEDPEATADRRWQGQHNAQAMATAADLRLTQRVVGAKLRQVRRLTAHESGFLQQHAPGPFKITMPGVMTRAWPGISPG